MRISRSLPVAIIGICAASILAFFSISYLNLKTSIETRTDTVLNNLLSSNMDIAARVLRSAQSELAFQAGSTVFIKALVDLSQGWKNSDHGKIKGIFLKDGVDRSEIVVGKNEEVYEFMHEAHHGALRNYVKQSVFDDILLADASGTIIYSVRKNDEFGQRIGALASIDILKTLAAEIASLEGPTMFYPSSKHSPYALVIQPMTIEDKPAGHLIGVLPASGIGAAFRSFGMIGDTGVIFLHKQDGSLLAASRELAAKELAVVTDGEAIKDIATMTAPDGNALTVASTALPAQFGPYRVSIQQQNDELYAPLRHLVTTLAIVGVIILAAVSLLVFFGVRVLSDPLSKVSDAIMTLAQGDLDTDDPIRTWFTEINRIAGSLSTFRENARSRQKLEAEADAKYQAELQRQAELKVTIDAFQAEISDILEALTGETETMASSAANLNGVAQDASREATAAKSSSDDATGSVQEVVGQTEQLSASIQEISAQTQKTSQHSEEATTLVTQTGDDISRLAKASTDIGDVIGFIREIAEQTNLLALNATIEAARAGEAGKGFAVVASEVKQLSNQTSRATEQIAEQIAQIQNASAEAVAAMDGVTEKISEINRFSSGIAAAVEEQGASTHEITQSISHAASGSSQASASVDNVSEAISRTTDEAGNVAEVATRLSTVAENLSTAVDGFLKKVS